MGAWPELDSAMRLVIPKEGDVAASPHSPDRWMVLPGLCCLASGGSFAATHEVSAAWLLIYAAAHVVDTIEDGDLDPRINKLGGIGPAINTANGLFLSAIQLIEDLRESNIPQGLAANILTDFLNTILVMTSGQHRDLTISQIDLNQWWQIAEAKSGEFFALACRAGAQLGCSESPRVQAYSDFGFHLGIMLQIYDDIEELQLVVQAKELVLPNSFEKSLAVAYALDVLPAERKSELTRLIQSGFLEEQQNNEIINILDDCGAGLYLTAELGKHYELSSTSLARTAPSPPAGNQLQSVIDALNPDLSGG